MRASARNTPHESIIVARTFREQHMNVVLWIVAGGLVGFTAFAALKLNLHRGLILSIAIGMFAALFGGHLLAPIFGATVAEGGEFNPFALLVAAASALACLSISDMTSKRVGL
jgi:uncharacterized membrane protein YeaQ/YmgE (transglycosylase-associated protein family)